MNLYQREENIIFVDYDLMLEKCKNCTLKKFDETECFKGKDIFFCTKTEKHFGDKLCLCCYKDFSIKNVEYEKYFIYALTGHKD